MPDEHFNRIEDMLGQLIKMVGNINSDQQEIKRDIKQLQEQLADVSQSINYLVHKAGEHDKDIYVLKKRAAEQLFGESTKA